MAQNKIYEELVYQIVTLLKQGEIYPRYMESIAEGKNDYKISQVYTKKNYSSDWIDTIEDCVVALDTIVRNPRKFIVIEEDIVDISLARSISVESVKHLSQHTNLISSVTKDGMVIPSKILNTSKEESYEIYENRFIYTLLLKLRDFIELRSKAMKDALLQSGELGVTVESDFAVDKNKVHYSMSGNANFPFDPVVKKSGSGLSNMERVARIKSIISDFLNSPFCKEMRSCALVRPPIQRTNVILKDPNFKKALVLWQYIETSEKMEFKIETSTETVEMNPVMAEKFRAIVYLNTILMQSIASTHETTESLESRKQKEKIIADEYVTKNIDDFVPDDFPTLKLDIAQIRTIYKRISTDKTLTSAEIKKINGAIDRVLRQYHINKLKDDEVARKKLIAEQAEEERQAKMLALREQKDLERKLRMERARKRLTDRKIEAEQKEEARRKEAEAAELRRQKELAEERIRKQQEELEAIRLKHIELKKQYDSEIASKLAEARELLDSAEKAYSEAKMDYDTAITEFTLEEARLEKQRREQAELEAKLEIDRETAEAESVSLKKLAAEKAELANQVQWEKVKTLKRLKEENEQFWANERRTAISLGVSRNIGKIQEREKSEIDKLFSRERAELEVLKLIEAGFKIRLEADALENLRKLAEIAYNYGHNDDIDRVINKRIADLRALQRQRKKQLKQSKKNNGKRK